MIGSDVAPPDPMQGGAPRQGTTAASGLLADDPLFVPVAGAVLAALLSMRGSRSAKVRRRNRRAPPRARDGVEGLSLLLRATALASADDPFTRLIREEGLALAQRLMERMARAEIAQARLRAAERR